MIERTEPAIDQPIEESKATTEWAAAPHDDPRRGRKGRLWEATEAHAVQAGAERKFPQPVEGSGQHPVLRPHPRRAPDGADCHPQGRQGA